MADNQPVSISNSEWSILEALWTQAPQTATQLVKAMEQKMGWAPSTTKTLISRLERKGCLRYEEGGRARAYYPTLDRSAVALAETKHFLRRVYQGRLGLMVNALVDRESLSHEEIDELRAILDKAEEGS